MATYFLVRKIATQITMEVLRKRECRNHPMRRILLAAGLLAAPSLSAQTSLTIYNDGGVLARRTLPTALAAGLSNHRLVLGLLDPASVFALDSGVAIVGSSYDESVDEQNTMRRAVGQTIKFWTGRGAALDTVSAAGVRRQPRALQAGRRTGHLPAPRHAALSRGAGPGRAHARPGHPGRRRAAHAPAGLLHAGGIVERELYRDPGQGHCPGERDGGDPLSLLRVADAEVQLLLPDRWDGPAGPPVPRRFEAKMAKAADMAQGPAGEQEIGEAHLYTIPGRISLEPGVTSSVALFDPAAAPWERAFVVRGQLSLLRPDAAVRQRREPGTGGGVVHAQAPAQDAVWRPAPPDGQLSPL